MLTLSGEASVASTYFAPEVAFKIPLATSGLAAWPRLSLDYSSLKLDASGISGEEYGSISNNSLTALGFTAELPLVLHRNGFFAGPVVRYSKVLAITGSVEGEGLFDRISRETAGEVTKSDVDLSLGQFGFSFLVGVEL